jgi:hypothetical protein
MQSLLQLYGLNAVNVAIENGLTDFIFIDFELGMYEHSGFQWVGAQDSRYLTPSAMNAQRSLPDSKLESGEEQGPSKWDPVVWSDI